MKDDLFAKISSYANVQNLAGDSIKVDKFALAAGAAEVAVSALPAVITMPGVSDLALEVAGAAGKAARAGPGAVRRRDRCVAADRPAGGRQPRTAGLPPVGRREGVRRAR